MKPKVLFIIALVSSFFIGFAINEITDSSFVENEDFKRVTGIGGIFFKSKNPATLKAWYNKHLGLDTDQYGTSFHWYQGADSTKVDLLNGAHLILKRLILNLPRRTS